MQLVDEALAELKQMVAEELKQLQAELQAEHADHGVGTGTILE